MGLLGNTGAIGRSRERLDSGRIGEMIMRTCHFTAILGLLALAFATAGITQAEARVRIKERTTFYSVTGTSGAAIFSSIRRRGPRANRAHAIATTLTETSITDVQSTVRRGRCVLSRFNVRMKITYRLPRWRSARGTNRRLRSAWANFSRQVKRHEDRHGAISKRYARDLNRALRRLSIRARGGNCNRFPAKVRATFDTLTRTMNRRHASFDRRESRMLSRSSRAQTALYRAR